MGNTQKWYTVNVENRDFKDSEIMREYIQNIRDFRGSKIMRKKYNILMDSEAL